MDRIMLLSKEWPLLDNTVEEAKKMIHMTFNRTNQTAPPETELIPIGLYNGIDMPGCHILDDSYVVYMEVPTPELNCQNELRWLCGPCAHEEEIDES
jgi:hypothetical protein